LPSWASMLSGNGIRLNFCCELAGLKPMLKEYKYGAWKIN